MNDLPPNVVGIHATGDVTQDDYEQVLLPRIDSLAKRQKEINYLLFLETDVTNFSLGAWWDDLKMGLKHFSQWNKIAVVTNEKGVEWFSNVFTHFIPGNSRGFPLDQLEEAKKWIAE